MRTEISLRLLLYSSFIEYSTIIEWLDGTLRRYGFVVNIRTLIAKVAELADALDLGSSPVRGGGSSPPFRTKITSRLQTISLQQINRNADICCSSPLQAIEFHHLFFRRAIHQ